MRLIHGFAEEPTDPPQLRRPPLDELKLFHVRVDLDGAEPPIWRRLELRSDLTLDVVHQVVQETFGWLDYHLHRFSLGGRPFDPAAQQFLCPFDVEESDFDGEGGVPAAGVRLDETMQQPGYELAYVYDYGDYWELTLRLEEVLPAAADAPTAVAVAGERAAPPEDSGGGADAASIAAHVDDPEHFDLDQINQALRAPYFLLLEQGFQPRLADLVLRLSHRSIGPDLTVRARALVSEPPRLTGDEMRASLQAYTWFIDRAKDGIPLTAAGYLKPADVKCASAVVPMMGGWIGTLSRERDAIPLLDFRRSLQSMRLLRKYKDKLLLTRPGAGVQQDVHRLWDLLATSMIPAEDGFERDATLLLLAYAATSAGHTLPLDAIAEALYDLGWQHHEGGPLKGYELHRLAAFDILRSVSGRPEQGWRIRISPAAAALARAALVR